MLSNQPPKLALIIKYVLVCLCRDRRQGPALPDQDRHRARRCSSVDPPGYLARRCPAEEGPGPVLRGEHEGQYKIGRQPLSSDLCMMYISLAGDSAISSLKRVITCTASVALCPTGYEDHRRSQPVFHCVTCIYPATVSLVGYVDVHNSPARAPCGRH